MTVPPATALSSTYEPKLKDYYAQYQMNQAYLVSNFWQAWLDPGIAGIESAAPFPGSSGTTAAGNFAPLPLEGAASAAAIAAILATGWQNYMLAITWPPMPPAAPFSAITSVVTSPTGVAAAFAILFSGLLAELVVVPPDPTTAFQEKGDAFAALFRTATLATGIMIIGLGIGAPPPPLIIPLSPVM